MGLTPQYFWFNRSGAGGGGARKSAFLTSSQIEADAAVSGTTVWGALRYWMLLVIHPGPSHQASAPICQPPYWFLTDALSPDKCPQVTGAVLPKIPEVAHDWCIWSTKSWSFASWWGGSIPLWCHSWSRAPYGIRLGLQLKPDLGLAFPSWYILLPDSTHSVNRSCKNLCFGLCF